MVSCAVLDVTEDTPQELGDISLTPDWSPVICTDKPNGAPLIPWPPVTITFLDSINLVKVILEPLLAKNNVLVNPEKPGALIWLKENPLIQFLELLRSKLNCKHMVQLKLLSQFMKIS